jgi:hypothetical protein
MYALLDAGVGACCRGRVVLGSEDAALNRAEPDTLADQEPEPRPGDKPTPKPG